MNARLEELYKREIRERLKEKLGFSNVMQVPRLLKIVINTGIKDSAGGGKAVEAVRVIVSEITGQAAVVTRAHKSIAGFKLREGAPIGAMVTLRGKRMYVFLDKLINVVLPSVRDFQGITTKTDGTGNYTLGIKDWMVFPEIDYDKIEQMRGLGISMHTDATCEKDALALLGELGMPFKRAAGNSKEAGL